MPRHQHFVTFARPGALFSDTTTQSIDAWEPKIAISMAKDVKERRGLPYGFYFTTEIVADPIDDGEGGTLEVKGNQVAKSGFYFIGGVLRKFDDIPESDSTRILRSNMRGNGWTHVVENHNSWRITAQFEKDSTLLDSDGDVISYGMDEDIAAYREETLLRWGSERKAYATCG